MPSEKELDLAFESALRDDPVFRAWFLSKISLGPQGEILQFLRANHPWGKFRVILPNAETGALEAVDKEGETDILAVFEGNAGRRTGVHIENKLETGRFTLYQPELYAARAEQWRSSENHGSYNYWITVLIAPTGFLVRNKNECCKFTSQLSHEDIGDYVAAFAYADDA